MEQKITIRIGEKKLEALMKDIETLENQTDRYLENIDGQPLAKTR